VAPGTRTASAIWFGDRVRWAGLRPDQHVGLRVV